MIGCYLAASEDGEIRPAAGNPPFARFNAYICGRSTASACGKQRRGGAHTQTMSAAKQKQTTSIVLLRIPCYLYL